jgi:pilus assembly protein Flp/PilA
VYALIRCDEKSLWIDHMSKLLIDFLKNDSGATAIEHGTIAGGISLAIITVGQSIGTGLGGILNGLLVPISSGPFSCP